MIRLSNFHKATHLVTVELFEISVITGKNGSQSLMCVLLCTMKKVAHFYAVNRGRWASQTWSGKGPGEEGNVCVFDRVSLSENKRADSSQWQIFPKQRYYLAIHWTVMSRAPENHYILMRPVERPGAMVATGKCS